MTKPAILKILLTFAVALVFAFVPKSASAKRGSGSHGGGPSHGGGGSRGGKSHGGASFHGGGHSSFRGGGQSYGGSRGGKTMSSARLSGGSMNMGRMNRGSNARPGGLSSSMFGNFSRSSAFGRGNFSSSVNNSRSFGYSGASQATARGSRSVMGSWQSFGNSAFRSTPSSARTSGMAMGGGWNSFGNTNGGGRAEKSRSYGGSLRADGQRQSFGSSGFRSTPGLTRTSTNASGAGWHSFGNMNGGARTEMPRGYGNNVRTGGQWRAFGNSRNESFGRNVAGNSFSAASRANSSDLRAFRGGFDSNRFSNMPAMSRFSSFSSFSGGRSTTDFGGSSRFGSGDFTSFGFGNSGFGGSGFSNSLLGSGLSLFPNLLFGGLLHLGTSVLGGGGILEGGLLAGNAISLAARLLGSGLGSNGYGQSDNAGVGFGYSPGGFGIGFGLAPAPDWPACNAVASFQGPGWGWGGYCGPSLYSRHYYPPAWNGISQFGDR
jgi:hypothetical protein